LSTPPDLENLLLQARKNKEPSLHLQLPSWLKKRHQDLANVRLQHQLFKAFSQSGKCMNRLGMCWTVQESNRDSPATVQQQGPKQ
jgi:hypothetical protein